VAVRILALEINGNMQTAPKNHYPDFTLEPGGNFSNIGSALIFHSFPVPAAPINY
jgi:hypothetical protein